MGFKGDDFVLDRILSQQCLINVLGHVSGKKRFPLTHYAGGKRYRKTE